MELEKIAELLQTAGIKGLVIFAASLIVVDIITGVWIAIFIEKNFNSKELQLGAAKKVLFMALIFITVGLDYLLKLDVFTRGYCIIVIIAQIKSIIENCSKYFIAPDIKEKGDINNGK